MFAKGQTVQIQGSEHSNQSVLFYFGTPAEPEWQTGNIKLSALNWTVTIPSSGHWKLEIINQGSIASNITVQAEASAFSSSLGILACLNPGDLFHND